MIKTLFATLPYSEVNFRFIYNHWDVHLGGTCMYNGELCVFENEAPDYDKEADEWAEMYVRIYQVSFIDKLKLRWRQFLFEQCVGYHWTYPYRKQGHGFYYRKPKWLYIWLFKKYFKLKKLKWLQ